MRMEAMLRTLGGPLLGALALVLAVSVATAEGGQTWQCGDGISVPLTGSRADRDKACTAAREKARRGGAPALTPEQTRELEQRVRQLEGKYGLDIDVKTADGPVGDDDAPAGEADAAAPPDAGTPAARDPGEPPAP